MNRHQVIYRRAFWGLPVLMVVALGGVARADDAWTGQEVGQVTPPGSDSADTTGVYTISGGGPDIYDHADAFHFVSQPVEGDWVFVARLTSLQKTDDWAKAGLMVRQNTTPGSLEVMIAQSAAKGVSFQFRDLPNARTDAFTYNNGGIPVWLRLIKDDDIISAYDSADGQIWHCRGVVQMNFKGKINVGMAVCSHRDDLAATATFENFQLTTAASYAPPQPWLQADVGTFSYAGGAHVENGVWNVYGEGSDIGGKADTFHYVYQKLTGDGSIVVHVPQVERTDGWTQGGIMMRETNDAGSKNASIMVTPEHNIIFQIRTSTDKDSTDIASAWPEQNWLKLERHGMRIEASASPDGTTWTVMGEETVDMNDPMEIGMAMTSHVSGAMSDATFDHVTVHSATPDARDDLLK